MGVDRRTELNFEDWYPTAHRQVLAALVAFCGDLHEAAEATDEAFVRAYARWSRVSSMSAPAGWTFVVARNVLRRRSGKRDREATVLRSTASEDTSSPDSADAVLAAYEVARALSLLTARQREVVVLHHGLDLTQEQVASLLHVSRSTVASTLRDAAERLETLVRGEAHA